MKICARLAFLACLAFATAAGAAPEVYRLDAARSQVGFGFTMEGTPQRGIMPVKSAQMVIDLDHVPASRVNVTLNAGAARAGVIFVTQTMKGPEVLDTARYPDIVFRSTSIAGTLAGARVTGDLTMRGVTRRITLDAGLYRQQGMPEGVNDRLTVLLTGAISRKAFGADGFAGIVGDRIDLRIIARIEK